MTNPDTDTLRALLEKVTRKPKVSEPIPADVAFAIVELERLAPTLAAETISLRERVKELEAHLKDAADNGLIYWEPQTKSGAANKATMLARIDRALKRETK
jgi:hypothetical protein